MTKKKKRVKGEDNGKRNDGGLNTIDLSDAEIVDGPPQRTPEQEAKIKKAQEDLSAADKLLASHLKARVQACDKELQAVLNRYQMAWQPKLIITPAGSAFDYDLVPRR